MPEASAAVSLHQKLESFFGMKTCLLVTVLLLLPWMAAACASDFGLDSGLTVTGQPVPYTHLSKIDNMSESESKAALGEEDVTVTLALGDE